MSGGSIQDLTICYSDIWRIDFETLEWFKLEYLHKSGTYHHIMCVVDDTYLYSIGGRDNNSRRLTTFERFTLLPPSLYRICLESICRSPNRASYLRLLPAAIVDELNLNDNDSSDT
ncbi:hypothetical protein RF11_06586 [Thelohanellus kitauei]|uniref:Kelch domain-containing protein 10 n=1 Tax=Thelohanellus kitauei TaxID=669202 RepID=A0A0C2M598_THEKT|nr:hypothetical protein RF11_06586 [Thelohanellus kitauei]